MSTSLAVMPAMELSEAKQRRDMLVELTRTLMTEGVDFGKIPGTAKNVLLKPGAEKLATFFGFSIRFSVIHKVEDWTGENSGNEPLFHYQYKASIYRGEWLIGEGIGSCNSRESKYRWRWVDELDVPPHIDPAVLRVKGGQVTEFAFAIEKAATQGKYGKPMEYWREFQLAIDSETAQKTTKDTAAGKTLDAWSISKKTYRVPNEDIFSIVNTIDKMAQKRALVAGMLIAANASEFFTQDMEDYQTDTFAGTGQATTSPPPKDKGPVRAVTQSNDRPQNGNSHQVFWAYQRKLDIDMDYTSQVLGDCGGDFTKALERLEVEFEGDRENDRNDLAPHPSEFGDQ